MPLRADSCAFVELPCLLRGQRRESHAIAGTQLSELPQLRLGHRHRAHEAAERGAVGAQNHRHIAGEVDGSNRVRVIVNVRGMQPRFPAVTARPCGFGPDQPYTRAARVVVNHPVARKELLDILLGKEIRCSVRSNQTPSSHVLGDRGNQFRGNGARLSRPGGRLQMQHVAGHQGTAAHVRRTCPRVNVARLPK